MILKLTVLGTQYSSAQGTKRSETVTKPTDEVTFMMELGARKLYSDSMIYVRETTIQRLERKNVILERQYKRLFWNAAAMTDQKDIQLAALQKVIASQATELKQTQKRLRWGKIKTGIATGVSVIASGAVIWMAVKDE
jgi:hypothetical protein